jgi:acyl dehydratase
VSRRFEDVEFGEDLPALPIDTEMANVRCFTHAAGMSHPRFDDHDAARKQGLPGAIVPGIMSQGALAALIHRWAPGSTIDRIDTVFRAPLLVDQPAHCRGVVTDLDEAKRSVEIDLTVADEAGETRVLGTATVRL